MLREHGVQVLTVGQYLRPTRDHLPVVRYWHPDEFAELEREAYALGFESVAAGPLVRSSYHAEQTLAQAVVGGMTPRVRALIAATLAAVALAVLLLPRDGAARSDRWTALTDSPLARTEVAAARLGRFVYVVGGFVAPGDGDHARPSSATTSAAIAGRAWPTCRSRSTTPPPWPTAGACTCTAATVQRAVRSPPPRCCATTPSATAGSDCAPHPRRARPTRWRPSTGASTRPAAPTTSGSLRSLEIYSLRRNRWSAGPSFPGPARNHTTGVASGGRFYVLAGRDAGNLTAAERYDPRRRVWQQLPPLRTARGGIAAVRLSDGRIVVFGGEELGPGGTTIAAVELFNPRTRRWRSLPDMLSPRHGLGGAALGRRVFAIQGGGSPGLFHSSAIEFLDVP